jgi:hypothetical protein
MHNFGLKKMLVFLAFCSKENNRISILSKRKEKGYQHYQPSYVAIFGFWSHFMSTIFLLTNFGLRRKHQICLKSVTTTRTVDGGSLFIVLPFPFSLYPREKET